MDHIGVYLYCFGVPLVPALIGIVGIFATRKSSPRRYELLLAGVNIYAMTVIPLFTVMESDFRYTVIGVAIAVILAALANIVAERKQPEGGKKRKLAFPLLISWLVWSGAMLFLNYTYFAGQYVIDWGGLVFGAVLMLCTPLFFITGLVSVTFFVRLFNQDLGQSADSKKPNPPPGTRDSRMSPSLSVLDIVQLSSGYRRTEESEERSDSA